MVLPGPLVGHRWVRFDSIFGLSFHDWPVCAGRHCRMSGGGREGLYTEKSIVTLEPGTDHHLQLEFCPNAYHDSSWLLLGAIGAPW